MIYDAHMHIGGSSRPDPGRLITRLAACGIAGGCVISIDPDDANFSYDERVKSLFNWVEGYKDRLFPIAWLHPLEADVIDKARELAGRGVAGFKFIANNYAIGDDAPARVFKEIEALGLPIIFHSGILYDFLASSKYNKPLEWERFIEFKDLRFSMGHCGHPWYDECLLVYGKFSWIREHARRAAMGEATIYRNNPWVLAHLTEDGAGFKAPRMFLDTTPGAHNAYRRDLLNKLVSCYPNSRDIVFGTDSYVEDYPIDAVKAQLKSEQAILDIAGAGAEFRENMYRKSMFAFLGRALPDC